MAASKTIALCGAGMISGAHAMAAHVVGASITAVASRTEAKSVERAIQLNTVSVSYEQLPAGADIVIVATPTAFWISWNILGPKFYMPKTWPMPPWFMHSSNE